MDQAGVTVPFAAKGFDQALARISLGFQATDNTPSGPRWRAYGCDDNGKPAYRLAREPYAIVFLTTMISRGSPPTATRAAARRI